MCPSSGMPVRRCHATDQLRVCACSACARGTGRWPRWLKHASRKAPYFSSLLQPAAVYPCIPNTTLTVPPATRRLHYIVLLGTTLGRVFQPLVQALTPARSQLQRTRVHPSSAASAPAAAAGTASPDPSVRAAGMGKAGSSLAAHASPAPSPPALGLAPRGPSTGGAGGSGGSAWGPLGAALGPGGDGAGAAHAAAKAAWLGTLTRLRARRARYLPQSEVRPAGCDYYYSSPACSGVVTGSLGWAPAGARGLGAVKM